MMTTRREEGLEEKSELGLTSNFYLRKCEIFKFSKKLFGDVRVLQKLILDDNFQ